MLYVLFYYITKLTLVTVNHNYTLFPGISFIVVGINLEIISYQKLPNNLVSNYFISINLNKTFF